MDILAHGLWSVAACKGASLKTGRPLSPALAAGFGVAPDLGSFGILFVQRLVTAGSFRPAFISHGVPDPSLVPAYISMLYDLTHSLVVFLAVFGIVWALRRRPLWEMGAWGLHILCDIPTHTDRFFPTPFLWPLSDVSVSVISWADPRFQIPNYLALSLTLWLLFRKKG